jgi:hypothetical protein
MATGKVLYEISTKGLTFLYEEILEVNDRGINYTNKGLFSLLKKTNIFIPFDQIAAFEVSKMILGFQTDLIITSTSGKVLNLKNVNKSQAEEAREIIYQSKEKALSSKMKNSSEKNDSKQTETMDVADQILKLSKLKEAGVITHEQFEIQKNKLLNL